MIGIGSIVIKKSGLPFKSGFRKATIKEFVTHPITKREAVILLEDNSIVEIVKLKEMILNV